ncbi:hypothetical protein HYV44_03140 [Candidatus Microgenomates bacterium]|nr:hypothetical protein [Candidatus Microgenomates bacterium]
MLYLVIINGLIDSFNPCAIGVLLSYLAIALSLRVKRSAFISFGLVYILATYATYFLIGLGMLKVMHLFGVHNFFGWLAAILILFLGVFHLKEYFWPHLRVPFLSDFLSRCRMPRWNREVTIASALVLGFLIGICEFPCSGGVYLATVGLLTVKATFWQGIFYLLAYNAMFILPLVIIFVSIGNALVFSHLQKLQTSTFAIVKLIMGISMLVSGGLLLAWLLAALV